MPGKNQEHMFVFDRNKSQLSGISRAREAGKSLQVCAVAFVSKPTWERAKIWRWWCWVYMEVNPKGPNTSFFLEGLLGWFLVTPPQKVLGPQEFGSF